MNEDFILGMIIGIFGAFFMMLFIVILSIPLLRKLGDMELGKYDKATADNKSLSTLKRR